MISVTREYTSEVKSITNGFAAGLGGGDICFWDACAFLFGALVNTNPSSSSIDCLFCPVLFAILSLDLRLFAGGESLSPVTCFFPRVAVLSFGGVMGGDSGYSFVCASFLFPFTVVVVVLVDVVDLRLRIIDQDD